jgi:hypothetical protein
MLPRALILSLALTLTASGLSRAQGTAEPGPADPQHLSIRATRRDTIRAGATVTAAFIVSSTRTDSMDVTPRVETPKDWTVLMGNATIGVPGQSSAMVMLSVAVPARATAGVYPIRVVVTSTEEPRGAGDSVLVVVPPRRALEVTLADRPGYVVSGRDYDASFLLRNRGNLPTQVRVRVKSTLGTTSSADSLITLVPEESRELRTRVKTRAGVLSASDDVLEVSATIVDDTAEAVEASARVTVVPEPTRKIEEFQKIPVQANVRAANTDGVSPFELFGTGYVRDGSPIRAEFLVRGKTGEYSPFGERDEYRLQINAPSWRARIGDHFFMLSPLTGGLQPGFGAGIDATRGAYSAGVHGQQFRRDPAGGTEAAAYAAAGAQGARLQLNAVTRNGGLQPGQVLGAMGSFARDFYHADVEVATTNDAIRNAGGAARTARVGATFPAYSFDIGHSFADTTFLGAQRGSQHNYLTANASPLELVSFSTNLSRHRTDISRTAGVPYMEGLDVGLLSATVMERFTVELQSARRTTEISSVLAAGRQDGARFRADQDFSFANVSFESEIGRSVEADSTRQYTQLSLGVRRGFTFGSASVWGENYSGGSIIKGAIGSSTVGGDATLRLVGSTSATLVGFMTRSDIPGSSWTSQMDARLIYGLRTGATISLRARLMSGGAIASRDRNVAYLEYGLPLRMPVSRLRTPGRVRGRVVDAVTGTGVPGALVRLGPQMAITDRDGEVAFGGVPGGQHRLSMSQETSFADAVFVGDPTVVVDSTQPTPTTFRLAIARGARVQIVARRFLAQRTGIAGAPDSLVDAGPLANATLVLSGERDTLYRTTSEKGTALFTDVPPGHWVIAIRGDAPAFHRFEPDRVELTLKPGETVRQEFRLVPRRREVQMIGDGQELKSTTADPKGQTQPGAVKVVKPDTKHDDRQR